MGIGDLREMLDGDGGYTVALPIGLAHRVKLRHDVAHGAVVCWSDVEFDANDETMKTRKAMEAAFAK